MTKFGGYATGLFDKAIVPVFAGVTDYETDLVYSPNRFFQGHKVLVSPVSADYGIVVPEVSVFRIRLPSFAPFSGGFDKTSGVPS